MKIFDLSISINQNIPVYPGDDAVSLTKIRCLEINGYNEYKLISGMHTGTHVEMPMHLTADNSFVSEPPIDCFCGSGVLLDVRGENLITMKPEYTTKIKEGCVVILYTGFSNFFNEPEKYFRDHPEIDTSLTDFFIHKRIKMLGMDMPSPDKPPFKAHLRLLENKIILIENLTGLNQLKQLENFNIFAVPLKIEAEASLVRAYAIN